MKIGIISENYFNDSKAYKVLLDKHVFKKGKKKLNISFIPIGKKIEGTYLLTGKVVRIINTECKKKNLDFVIFAKDLDALSTDRRAIQVLTKKIEQIAQQVSIKILPFIVIFEQEALILADIKAFNKEYGTNSSFSKDPKLQPNPKKLLKKLTNKTKKKYKESDTPEIFQQLDFQTVFNNHKGENSFQSFIKELEKAVI